MNKPPAFQFYADDFLAGTFSMTNEERGLYITLLCRQWTQGHITADEIARLSSNMAQPLVSHVVAKFKDCGNGEFKNARMEVEREKQAAFRANRSESGKAGADKRWHSYSIANGKRMASGMAKHSSPSPSPSSYNNTISKPQPSAAECEAVYSLYPKKVGKGAALKAIKKAIADIGIEKLTEAVREYAQARAGADHQFTPNPATWFNRRSYLDDRATWIPRTEARPWDKPATTAEQLLKKML